MQAQNDPYGVKAIREETAALRRTAERMAPNPVVRRTPVYPGWVVREYADGTFDGAQLQGVGVTIGFATFKEALREIRARQDAAKDSRVMPGT